MKLSRKINFSLVLLRFGQILLFVGVLLTLIGLFVIPQIDVNVQRDYQTYFMNAGIISLSISIIFNVSGIIKIKNQKK